MVLDDSIDARWLRGLGLAIVSDAGPQAPSAPAGEVLLLCGRDGNRLREAVARLRRTSKRTAMIVLCPQPTVELASWCMRHGVADLLAHPIEPLVLIDRVRSAAARGQAARAAALSRSRDRALARRALEALRSQRNEPTPLAGSIGPRPGAHATAHPNSHANPHLGSTDLSMVRFEAELETLLRQELDVEPLLRTTLEFLIRKLGAMNAAIFLPGSTGDFSLGAYVNYDCPRDRVQGCLDELCGLVLPQAEEDAGMRVLAHAYDDARINLSQPDFLREAGLVVYSCHHDGECIAVLTLFRDAKAPWATHTLSSLDRLGSLFGQQLARAVRTSHRHLSDDKDWDEQRKAA